MKGTLIPVGGNEDKQTEESQIYTRDFLSEGILSNIVREAGGKAVKIVIIPTASGIPIEVAENYLHAFTELGCNNLKVLNVQSREEAESSENLRELETAQCIMMSGGDQSKLSAIFGGTKAHTVLQKKLLEEEIVIAGTSAGAMAMSQEMIEGGSSRESLVKGAVLMGKGLGLLPNVIIDSHFIRRGRFGRLAEAVASKNNLMGIGLAEDTGLIIKNQREATVIGSGMVIVFDPSDLSHNRYALLDEGTPLSLGNLKTHVLANSDQIDLQSRALNILPIEASFV